MRMWMVNPACMCNQHLLGEHVECHMLVGHLKKRKQIINYIRLNFLEPKSLRKRHNQLALEMVNRGMKHKSPLNEYDLSYLPKEHRLYTVNIKDSLNELLRRCSKCRKLSDKEK